MDITYGANGLGTYVRLYRGIVHEGHYVTGCCMIVYFGESRFQTVPVAGMTTSVWRTAVEPILAFELVPGKSPSIRALINMYIKDAEVASQLWRNKAKILAGHE